MPIPKKKIARKETNVEESQLNVNEIITNTKNTTHVSSIDDIDKDDLLCGMNLDDIDEDELFGDLNLDGIEDIEEFKKNSYDAKTNITSISEETSPSENSYEEHIVEEDPEERRRKLCTPCNFWGYEITSLLSGEEYILKKLNLSEEMMSNYYLAKNVYLDYMRGYDDLVFKKNWGFPCSERYIGYIMNCTPSQKRAGEYIVELLANDYDVCLFKFSTSFRDVVYNGVKRDLNLTDNIFRRVDFTALKGFLVILSVENIRLENGRIYSKITDFKTIDKSTIKILDKLLNDMMR